MCIRDRRYRDTGISAGVAYDGEGYRTVCIGFPIETVKDMKEIGHIFDYCLEYFKK